MTKNISISPSIIAADLSRMGEIVETFDPAVIDLLHIDVMDGHFVPNMTFGPAYIGGLKKHSAIPLDIHLMIERPEDTMDRYLALEPWCVTFHYEATRFPARLLREIKDAGPRAGITINPATPVESVFDILPYADMVLIMSVDPGFYGQKFMPEALGRIKKLADFAASQGQNDLIIQVDGGVNNDNIKSIVDAGAGILVAGGAAFKGDPFKAGTVNNNVAVLKKAALS